MKPVQNLPAILITKNYDIFLSLDESVHRTTTLQLEPLELLGFNVGEVVPSEGRGPKDQTPKQLSYVGFNKVTHKINPRSSKPTTNTISDISAVPSGGDPNHVIFWQFRSDVDQVVVVDSSANSKTTMTLAEARFKALRSSAIPDLGVQGHTVEPLKVEKDRAFQNHAHQQKTHIHTYTYVYIYMYNYMNLLLYIYIYI